MPAAALAAPSVQTIFDEVGRPISGAKVYYYVAGTTTPLIVYTTKDLDVPHARPVVASAGGRVPPVYVGEVTYKARIADATGTLIDEIDGIQGAVPVPIDPTPVEPGTKIETGFMMDAYRTDPVAGWVRANGRTLGSATSGALELADATAEDLFLHLWNEDPALVVSGGRGVSAALDWAANKTIELPLGCGRGKRGRDKMGRGTTAGVITTATFADPDKLGSFGGAEKITLTEAQGPIHDHPASSADAGLHNHPGGGTSASGDHQHIADDQHQPSAVNVLVGGGAPVAVTTPPTVNDARGTTGAGNHSHTVSIPDGGTHSHTVTVGDSLGGEPHNNMPPDMLVTFYIKL